MRRIAALGLFVCLSMALAGPVWSAAFTPGNLVVYRVGDGTNAVSAAATAVFLDEYRQDGTLVQSLAMPTATGSAPLTNPLTASSTGSEGLLNRSIDGQCLTVPGYAAPLGTAGVAGVTTSATAATQRSVAFVSASGGIDTTTRLGSSAFSKKSPRGAVSDSCGHAWLSGDGNASANQGVWYVTLGATTSTQIYSAQAVHGIDISGGQLYASLKSLTLNSIGSGLPTTAGQAGTVVSANIANLINYRGIAFLDLQPGVAGYDTLYLANNSNTTIDKYSFDGTSWTAKGHINATGNAQGLTAVNLGDGYAALYFTDSNTGNLYRAIDNAGPTGTLTATPTLLATASGSPTNALFYGVAPTPESSMPSQAPAAATNANTTSITATGFTANWTAPTSGGAVAFYVVEISTDNFASSWQTVMVPASQTNAAITGLTGGTHYFRVRAVNSFGASSDLTSGAIVAPNTAPTITLPVVTDGTDTVGYPLTAGDSNEPMTSTGLSFTVSDAETAVGSLTVTAGSNNTAALPNANLHVNCVAGACTLTIDTAGLATGYATVTISATDTGDAQNNNVATTTAQRKFAISARSAADIAGNTNPRWIAGRSDSSDGIVSGPVGSNYVLVADDEPGNVINLWDRSKSGLPIKVFNLAADLQVNTGKTGVDCVFAATIAHYGNGDCNTNLESDMEGATRVGNVTYWTGSHSNSSDGLIRPARWRYFAYTINDTAPANPSLSFVGYYKYLRADLVNWDHNNSHGLGADYFGLTASTADGRIPESTGFDGFNIEGLTTSPNDSVGWFAFRAPLVPAPGQPAVIPGSDTGRTHALIIQAPHYNDTTNVLTANGGTYNATTPSIGLGMPIRLDLGGRGIRDIKKNAAGQYLIIAGPSNSATGSPPYDFRLFTWDGSFDGTGLATNLHMRAANFASFTAPNYGGAVEGIIEVPDTSNAASSLDLISDSGDVVYYGDGVGAKDLDGDVNAYNNNYPIKKSRIDTVTLGGIVSFNANLGNLVLGGATLDQSFASGTISYTATVSNNVTSVTVTPTVADNTATVKVNGSSVTSGTASGAIALTVGANTITVLITAQDGSTTKTYSVTVNRTAPPAPPPPAVPVCTLTASPAKIAAGGFSALSVSCTPSATSYAWTNSGFASSVSSGTVSPSVTTIYTVTGINAGGSGKPAIAAVNVGAVPDSAIQFAPVNYSVAENAGNVSLTVFRTGDLSGTASVTYSTCGSGCSPLATAISGTDFVAGGGVVSFGPGESSQTIPVAVTFDAAIEGNETFNVVLSNPVGATLGAANTAKVTILDGQDANLTMVGQLFNIPSPDNTDSAFLRFTNLGATTVPVTGTLYDQDGNQLGTRDLALTAGLSGKGVLALGSADIAAFFGIPTWPGRAWMEVKSSVPASTLKLQNLIRAKALTDMSCVSDRFAINVPASGNADQAYLRFYNIGLTAGTVRATLYDQSGNALGVPNSILVSSLGAKSVVVMTADMIQAATAAPGWTGRAWLEVAADFGSNLKIMSLIRDASGALNDMNCAQPLNAVGELYNIASPGGAETAYLHIYNVGTSAATVTGTLYDQSGTLVGAPNRVLTANLPPKGVLVLDSPAVAAIFGAASWSGPARMEVASSQPNGALLIQNLVRSSSLSDVTCVSDRFAVNIPASGNTDQAVIRLYNLGGSAGAVRGTLYDQSGNVLGNANSILAPSVGANAWALLTADQIQSATGTQAWSGRAWLDLAADFGSKLKVMNLIRDSGNTSNDMSCLLN